MAILIVDDSATMRLMIEKELKRLGYHDNDLIMCNDSRVVLQILRTQPAASPIQLILLDWHIPGMNGFELLRLLKKGHFKDIPVIMLTVEQKKENIMKAIHCGCRLYY